MTPRKRRNRLLEMLSENAIDRRADATARAFRLTLRADTRGFPMLGFSAQGRNRRTSIILQPIPRLAGRLRWKRTTQTTPASLDSAPQGGTPESLGAKFDLTACRI